MRWISVLGASAAAGLAAPALAQLIIADLEADPASSTFKSDFRLAVQTSGTLIGDHDPVANPDGTRTLPGLFGGSGNQPVPIELTIAARADGDGRPEGAIGLVLDRATGGAFAVHGLELDLIGASPVRFPLELTFRYQTFRTFNPNSTFPGGIPVTIPIGEGEITSIRLTLAPGPAGGMLTPSVIPGEFDLQGAAPVLMELDVEFLGEPFPVPPIPAVLPLEGRLRVDANTATLRLQANLSGGQTIPGPIPGPQDIPFALPTVLPPGETANVLLSLDIDEIDIVIGGETDVLAGGPIRCYADCNGDGRLDFFDFLCFQDAFLSGGGLADCDRNGRLDFFDFLCFQDTFLAGCP